MSANGHSPGRKATVVENGVAAVYEVRDTDSGAELVRSSTVETSVFAGPRDQAEAVLAFIESAGAKSGPVRSPGRPPIRLSVGSAALGALAGALLATAAWLPHGGGHAPFARMGEGMRGPVVDSWPLPPVSAAPPADRRGPPVFSSVDISKGTALPASPSDRQRPPPSAGIGDIGYGSLVPRHEPQQVAPPRQQPSAAPQTIPAPAPEPDEMPIDDGQPVPGLTSPMGSTGAGKADGKANVPPGPPIDASKLPPIPAPRIVPAAPAKAADAKPASPAAPAAPAAAQAPLAAPPAAKPETAAPARPESAKPEAPKSESGLEGRAQQAEEQGKLAVDAAREAVKSKGADSAAQEMEQLKNALAILNSGDRLTPEVVRQLPHDVAKRLQDAGLVMSPEDASKLMSGGKTELRIVRLPADVLDRFRSKEGVPTVPEANSWAATGGNVVIPLPGGGEIRSPQDLATFHLSP